MQVLAFLGYLALGVVQWVATVDGLAHWTGMNSFFAGIVAFVIAGLPVIGTIFGFIGAIDVWGWAWWQAGLLFFGGFGFIVVLGGATAIGEFFQRKRA